MFFAAMLVHAMHPALEDRKEIFGGVSMHVAANVFLLFVVHSVMPRELAANFVIIGAFVGHHGWFACKIGADDRRNVGNASAFHMEATG